MTKNILSFALLGVLVGWTTPAGAQESPGSESVARAFAEATTQSTAPEPPTPEHTGFGALVHETWSDFKSFPRRESTWVILGVGAGLAAAAHPVDHTLNSHMVGSVAVGRFFAPGKYIGGTAAQTAFPIGLYFVGRYLVPTGEGKSRTNKVSHLGFDLLRAQIVSGLLTQGMKLVVQRPRPSGQCCAFPSGHATAAFATASVLERHFGYRMAWPTLLIATYVGASRLHDNVHYLSDVAMGSAMGMAAGWTVVGRHGRSNYALNPVPVRGGVALMFTRREPPDRQ